MSKQSVSEIIDSWETHGLQNLHEINLDRIYAFPLTRNDLDIRESSDCLRGSLGFVVCVLTNPFDLHRSCGEWVSTHQWRVWVSDISKTKIAVVFPTRGIPSGSSSQS